MTRDLASSTRPQNDRRARMYGIAEKMSENAEEIRRCLVLPDLAKADAMVSRFSLLEKQLEELKKLHGEAFTVIEVTG